MKYLESDKIEASILSGNRKMHLGNISRKDKDWTKFQVFVQSIWFDAIATCEASNQGLKQWSQNLIQLSDGKKEEVEFIAEYGVFEVRFKLMLTGQCNIHGLVGESLSENERLTFEFISNVGEISNFANSLLKNL